jgi:hypothetical protein
VCESICGRARIIDHNKETQRVGIMNSKIINARSALLFFFYVSYVCLPSPA